MVRVVVTGRGLFARGPASELIGCLRAQTRGAARHDTVRRFIARRLNGADGRHEHHTPS